MPIVKIENINEDCSLGLWKIDENTDLLFQSCLLSEEEKTELGKINFLRRKKEWLAARVLLRALIEGLGIPYNGIHKDEHCKPFLISNGYHISIAHSFPLAGVIINRRHACGIDIEKPKPSLFHIAPKFLSEKESDYVQKKPADLCLAWAAKEVMFKLYGRKKISFRENLLINPYIAEAKGQIEACIRFGEDNVPVKLNYEQLEDTLICYSL